MSDNNNLETFVVSLEGVTDALSILWPKLRRRLLFEGVKIIDRMGHFTDVALPILVRLFKRVFTDIFLRLVKRIVGHTEVGQ